MATIIKIDHIRLGKLNNAEYARFMRFTAGNILTVGYTHFGIPKAVFDEFSKKLALLVDIISQSRTSDETACIADADQRCDDALRYMMGLLERGRFSPVAEDRAAYQSLYNLTKPYRGINRLPQRQQIQQTEGLLTDLEKMASAEQAQHLGLWPALTALREANKEYAALIKTRAEEQVAADLPAGRAVRDELDVLYDQMMSFAFAESVKAPTAYTAAFIASQNKLIADTNAAYNLRMGLLASHREKAEGGDGGGSGEDGSGGSDNGGEVEELLYIKEKE